MVIYFSWSGNTKAYAEELATKKGLKTFQIQEEKERKGKLSFLIGCFEGITKKKTKVVALPNISKCDEIFICSPIWAAGPAPAIRYFLNEANLKNKKVNFLFTYGSMTEPSVFKKNTADLLMEKGCVIGDMYAFAAKFKQKPDLETIKKNISEVVK